MHLFNEQFKIYKKLLESPENYANEGDLLVDSDDVVTFIYIINKKSMIMGDIGLFISHSDLIREIKLDRDSLSVIKRGDMSVEDIAINNTIMGRFWKNHKKVSIWDYMKNQFEHVDLKQAFKNMSRLANVNFMHYELEITEVGGRYIGDGKIVGKIGNL